MINVLVAPLGWNDNVFDKLDNSLYDEIIIFEEHISIGNKLRQSYNILQGYQAISIHAFGFGADYIEKLLGRYPDLASRVMICYYYDRSGIEKKLLKEIKKRNEQYPSVGQILTSYLTPEEQFDEQLISIILAQFKFENGNFVHWMSNQAMIRWSHIEHLDQLILKKYNIPFILYSSVEVKKYDYIPITSNDHLIMLTKPELVNNNLSLSLRWKSENIEREVLSKFKIIDSSPIVHLSANKHWIVTIEDQKQMFLKRFTDERKFKNEYRTLEAYHERYQVKRVKGNYYLMRDYYEVTPVIAIDNSNYQPIAKCLSDYYQLFDVRLVSKREYFQGIYEQIRPQYHKLLAEVIYQFDNLKFIPLYRIHGDFGIRNIFKADNDEYKLIDFERAKYELVEVDLIKLLYRELYNNPIKQLFIKQLSYELDYPINFASKEMLVGLLKTISGIDDYLEKFEDQELSIMRDEMLSDVRNVIEK